MLVIFASSLLAAYIVTGISLFALAMFLFHLCPKDAVAMIGIVAIYGFSCLLGGFLAGKKGRKHKWLYGLLTGTLYYLCIVLIGIAEYGLGVKVSLSGIRTLFVCMASGMVGGMLS